MNKKVYSPKGTKQDELGNFDWVSEQGYGVKDASKRFIFGSNGETSEFRLRQYIPLTMDESAALINVNCRDIDISCEAYNRHPLLTVVKAADLMACYLDERS